MGYITTISYNYGIIKEIIFIWRVNMGNFKNIKLIFILIISLTAVGCSAIEVEKEILDPDRPITVTLWHYYNGHIKDKFDAHVAEFNETIGMERGIVVDAQSQGDVVQLSDAVFDAANQSIGTEPMPDIFAVYPDNAIRVHQITELVNLETYFSKQELNEYRSEFLEEGKFNNNGNYYIVPIAKSSENLFVNKDYWEIFASKYGYTNEDLYTWEGITKVAAHYHEVTGNGFFGIDANANYMLQAAKQLGTEMFIYKEDGNASLNFKKDIAKKVWDNYYVPYLKGHFIKTGRFSSDDAKTGTVLAYTGSTAGAAYFPTEVTFSQEKVVPIEVLVLPYPHFKDGKPFAFQQGAGMCIVKSDTAHELAATEFLKWFTATEQNLKFTVSTGYLPVKNEALNEKLMLEAMETTDISNPAIRSSIITTSKMFEDYKLYNSKPFNGSYEIRELFESNLSSKVSRDLSLLEKQLNEEDIELLIQNMISESEFEEWYSRLISEVKLIFSRYHVKRGHLIKNGEYEDWRT